MAKLTSTVGHVKADNRGQTTVPVSPNSPWHVANANAEEEQDSGTRITDPGTVDNDANITTWNTNGSATTIEVAMQYVQVGGVSQECVVNVFGVDSNGLFQALPDSDGDIDVTLTADVTNDIAIDGTNDVTTAKKFDLLGNRDYEVHIKDQITTVTSVTASIIAREY